MHIHKINKQKHTEFLLQKRQDPITGDLIVEGDEIVFCQECKSVFLKDTWEYLEKTHCNQSRTLATFPIKKILNLKSKREYFKTYLHSISDWKDFDTRLKMLPWVLSSLDMKEYIKNKNKPINIVLFVGYIATIFAWIYLQFTEIMPNSSILFVAGLVVISVLFRISLNSNTTSINNNKPSISIEKDKIIVFMPYKEQKVTLAKYKVEEIELITKENSNYKLRISYKGGTMFFYMNLNNLLFNNLIETLYDWSNTVRIDLTNVKFHLSSKQDYSYLYSSLDIEEEHPNLLLP